MGLDCLQQLAADPLVLEVGVDNQAADMAGPILEVTPYRSQDVAHASMGAHYDIGAFLGKGGFPGKSGVEDRF